jgi:hypothetical protein
VITNYTIYKYFHKCCPGCGSDKNLMTTLVGYLSGPEGIKDENKAQCHKCQWKGIVDDLLPVDKDHGPISEGHVCKHNVCWPHSCTFCEDHIWAIISGKIPV